MAHAWENSGRVTPAVVIARAPNAQVHLINERLHVRVPLRPREHLKPVEEARRERSCEEPDLLDYVCPPSQSDLTGSNKGPGTKWGRKDGALMLNSGTTRLFCGLFLSKKGHSKVPDILQAIELLRKWGFTIEHVTGDREISCYEVIGSLLAQGTLYLGSIKRLAKEVKKAIKAYLAGTGRAVVAITFQPTPACQYRIRPLKCYLILKPDRGKRVRDLQKRSRPVP